MLVDKSLEELWAYRPDVAEPTDFDAFWKGQRAAVSAHPLDVTFAPGPLELATVEVLDVTFAGHGGAPVKAWLLLPRRHAGPLPTVVQYIGYGGGRGLPHERLFWASAGFANLIMDTRGQGSTGCIGDTPDPGDSGAPSAPGFLTRGIAEPAQHYYTRLFLDAARAVDAAKAHPAVDPDRIAVLGGSQGGGMALAASHLADGVRAVSSSVPFLAHFRRAVEVTDAMPYFELTRYCRVHRDRVDEVFATLSYLDVVNHGKRAQAPALFGVGLADRVCPPSTVFAAYHAYGGDKDIRVYPFNEHEGGGAHHQLAELAFLREALA